MFWKKGRQGGGYERLTIISPKFTFGRFDLHILRMREGASVPLHKDYVPKGREHHRLNIRLRSPEEGGEFITMDRKSGKPMRWNASIVHFRPDVIPHGVATIKKGVRYVLSIGWTRNSPWMT